MISKNSFKSMRTGELVKYFELFGLILIASLAQFATDIYLPSLPAIADFFNVDMNASQLSIAVYMFALTITQLFWGPVSDATGRKSALYVGLFISILGSIVCANATSITMLIIGRFIQGLGNGAAAGLFRAILRDMYTGKELASLGSYFSNFLVLVLMLAPVIGGFFQKYYTWRASFVFLLFLSLLCAVVLKFAIRESLKIRDKDVKSDWKLAYKRLLSSPVFMGCCLSNFLTYGGMFAWITSSSSILIDQMQMSPMQFGFWSGVTGAGLMIGAFFNGTFVKKVGITKMLYMGWSIIIFSGLILMLSSWAFGPVASLILISVFCFYIGSSLIFANTNATAFSPFGDIAGTAAGLYAFIQLSGGAAMSYLIATINESGSLFLGIIFFLSGASAWIVFFSVVRHQDV
jgi:Bcr/CflA subfamily drug resistance transporter